MPTRYIGSQKKPCDCWPSRAQGKVLKLAAVRLGVCESRQLFRGIVCRRAKSGVSGGGPFATNLMAMPSESGAVSCIVRVV